VLRYVPAVTDPAVVVDASHADDAAVIRLAADRALVFTTDFFTPIVDDPEDFGRIAAANALSDVYAMGGRPAWCLSLVAWPRDVVPLEVLGRVLAGAAETVTRAGAAIVGGHSIDDPEPKFGLVVVGEVHPDRVTTIAAARPGDRLVLTKPIGTGVVATAIKRQAADSATTAAAVASMTHLNDGAAAAAREAGVRAATDVTGFGLLGHLRSMLLASGCAAELEAGAVPILPGARALAESGFVPGGTRRNVEAVLASTSFEPALEETDRILLADAQTSGGLLLAVPGDKAEALRSALRARATPAAAIIGTVVAGEPGRIAVRAAVPAR
jgi:selenide,water dikinase